METKKFIGFALLATILLLTCTSEVEAAYTYIDDDTYPEIGWVDVEQIGWDVNTLTNELLLTVQYQEGLPVCTECPCHYKFRGFFYCDTDQDPSTGSQWSAHYWSKPRGTDYQIQFIYDVSYSYYSLSRWDDAMDNFVLERTEDGTLTISPENDTVTLTIPLTDLNSPAAIDIVYKSYNELHDYIGVVGTPAANITYNIDSEDRAITVDGDPTDWADDISDVTDPTGDMMLSWTDATSFYVTDDSTTNRLCMRMDFAAPPLNLHPEEESFVHTSFTTYFDMDEDPGTGYVLYEWRGIGTEYILSTGITTNHTFQRPWTCLARWDESLEEWCDGTFTFTTETASDTCVEWSTLLSDWGIPGDRTDIPISVHQVHTETHDRVPNSGAFTVTTGIVHEKFLSNLFLIVLVAFAIIFIAVIVGRICKNKRR